MDATARCGEAKQMAHRRRLMAAALVAGAVLALAACSTALALSVSSSFGVERLCGVPQPGAAACIGMKLVPTTATAAESAASAAGQPGEAGADASPAVTYKHPFAGYLTAQDLHTAYALPSETASSTLQTIAVVDAFDDPTAEADLGVYDETFGLSPCTTANGCFRKIDQEGHTSPLPRKEGEWASEISIDVQMAHAVCQGCRVLLVEADNEDFTSLGAAVNAAVGAGATEISNSYAGPEEPTLSASFSEYNSRYYDHPGVVVTASSGDCGYLNEACRGERHAANFPADSPDVVAVGGTSLTSTGETWSSTVWDEGGSGCSQIFTAPLWQVAVPNFAATGCEDERSIADVAAIGDPETGVNVYDSTPEGNGSPTGWGVWGGTSVSSPIIAAEFALAGGSHGVSYPAATLYAHAGEATALDDVVSGSNGTCSGASTCQAEVGFDGPSGVGSPIGLRAFSIPGSPASSSAPTVSGAAELGQTLTETAGVWNNGPTSRSDQWERCNAYGGGCAAIAGAIGSTYSLTASDVGSTIRVQETAGNASGIGPPAASAPTATVASNVAALTSFTPTSAITGSAVMIYGTGFGAASAVAFGALPAKFKVLSSTQIEATVPDGARAATISVSTPEGVVTSKGNFTATLSVTSFSPKSGTAGALVTIKGVGFNGHSTVSFGGVTAHVKSASAKKLKVTVPSGAAAGAIAVTNTTAPLGTVHSAGSFTP
jgi:IPT/TIG domain